jgi:hypothetical protein
VKRLAALAAVLALAGVGVGLWQSSSATPRSASNVITLTCSDSPGQQERGQLPAVGGVTGLVLPDSVDPAGLSPLGSSNGKLYFAYKAFLAVSRADAPYATVTVTEPRAGVRLWYGRSGSVQGRALIAASRSSVRLPVCGSRYTGYVGGIILTGPARVTLSVSSAHRKTAAVRIAIGTD